MARSQAECNTNVSSLGNDNAVGQTVNAFEQAVYAGLESQPITSS